MHITLGTRVLLACCSGTAGGTLSAGEGRGEGGHRGQRAVPYGLCQEVAARSADHRLLQGPGELPSHSSYSFTGGWHVLLCVYPQCQYR